MVVVSVALDLLIYFDPSLVIEPSMLTVPSGNKGFDNGSLESIIRLSRQTDDTAFTIATKIRLELFRSTEPVWSVKTEQFLQG
jgi:hypothetical protein